ncbi:MAG: hypothetical protein L0215_22340 [Gemmataceae bacterium]|nr:hypothetical protein [Gemmataceae bacterium]
MRFIKIDDPDFLEEFLKKLESPRELSPVELKEIYAAYKEQYTAADLQKHTEPMQDGVWMDDLMTRLREKQRLHFTH